MPEVKKVLSPSTSDTDDEHPASTLACSLTADDEGTSACNCNRSQQYVTILIEQNNLWSAAQLERGCAYSAVSSIAIRFAADPVISILKTVVCSSWNGSSNIKLKSLNTFSSLWLGLAIVVSGIACKPMCGHWDMVTVYCFIDVATTLLSRWWTFTLVFLCGLCIGVTNSWWDLIGHFHCIAVFDWRRKVLISG